MILISTKASDVHAFAIAQALNDLGAETEVLEYGGLVKNPDHFQVHNLDKPQLILNGQAKAPKLVWFRKLVQTMRMPEQDKLSDYESANVDEAFTTFATGLQSFLALTDNTINPPHTSLPASNKIYQARVAKRMGLRLPQTIFATKPDKAALLKISDADKNVIYKPLRSSMWRTDPDKKSYAVTQTALIHIDDILEYPGKDYVPAIFQQPIEKASEVRVCVFGRHIIAIEQRPEGTPNESVDWRVSDFNNGYKFNQIELPDRLKTKILKFMETLHLQVGAFDFAVDKQGNLHFLEVNPFGQFLYLEEFNPEIQLFKTAVQFLIEEASYQDQIKVPADLSVLDYKEALEKVSSEHMGTGTHIFDQISRKGLSVQV